MRKLLILALILGFSSLAFSQAVVRDTPHNLSPAGTNQALQAAAGTLGGQICIYCHTPHGASSFAPLWNRASQPAGTVYVKYTSATMNATQPTDAQIINSVSGGCLSCHDGTVAVDNLLNYNGAPHAPSESFTPLPAATATYGPAGTGTNNIMTGGIPFLGTDLSNDHPIAIVYEQARAAQVPSEFNNYAGALIAVTDGINTLPLFGTAQTTATVECGSCHNPHNNTFDNFLRINNTGSAVCYTCHIK